MAYLFVGSEAADFLINGIEVETNAVYFDTNFLSRCFEIDTSSDFADAVFNATSRQFFGRLTFGCTNNNWIDTWFYLYDALGRVVMRFGKNTVPSNTPLLQTFDTAGNVLNSYSNTSTVYALPTNQPNVVTFSLDLSATGHFEVTLNGVVMLRVDGDFSALQSVAFMRITGMASFTAISEVIIATDDCRSDRLMTLNVTADGTQQQWTGAVTAINGPTSDNAAGHDDATFISSAAAGQVDTYAVGDVYAAATGGVAAVVVSARCKRGTTGPQNLDAIVRVGGTDYGVAFAQPDTTFAPRQVFFETNPATGSAWTKAEVNGAEVGVRSAT